MGAAVLGFALLLTSAQAQSAAEANSGNPPGLLGRTYTSFDLGVERFQHLASPPTGWMPGVDLNLPMSDNFDDLLGVSYLHAAKGTLKLSGPTFENSVSAYYRTKIAAPFLSLGVGYAWQKSTVAGVATRDNHLLYDAAAGFEIPLRTDAALRIAVERDESFRRPHARNLGYDIAANYWLSDVVGTSLGAEVKHGRGGAYDAITYTAGVHFSFD